MFVSLKANFIIQNVMDFLNLKKWIKKKNAPVLGMFS